jgi:hypothetical protein
MHGQGNSGLLREVCRLRTSGARAAAIYELEGSTFLAVPQLAYDIPGTEAHMNGGDSDTDLLVFRWTGAHFEETCRLAAPGGEERLERIRFRAQDEFLDATGGDDFIGVQTYTRRIIGPEGALPAPDGSEMLEMMGYEYYPAALGGTIRYAWERTGGRTPILVTENGIGTADDDQRIAYVREALGHVHACLEDGIDVTGYTYWSLLDNFEWNYGYGPRFGLVEVDRTTFARTPKPSARWLAEVVRANALDVPVREI